MKVEGRLLDQQAKLIEFLTDPAMFRGPGSDTFIDPTVAALDLTALRFIGERSLYKRMDKVGSVLPRTFNELGTLPDYLVSDFASACPPYSASTLANAEQFVAFAYELWERKPPHPRYLIDLAVFELALARVTATSGGSNSSRVAAGNEHGWCRAPGIATVACAHDIRALFDDGAEDMSVIKRCVFLLVVSDLTHGLRIFEVEETAHKFLETLIAGPMSDAELERRRAFPNVTILQRLESIGAVSRLS